MRLRFDHVKFGTPFAWRKLYDDARVWDAIIVETEQIIAQTMVQRLVVRYSAAVKQVFGQLSKYWFDRGSIELIHLCTLLEAPKLAHGDRPLCQWNSNTCEY